MPTANCPPHTDYGPNDYAPTPAGDHWDQVNESMSDGDATFLVTATGGAREVWAVGVSAIPDGSVIVDVAIRSTQKRTTAGTNTYHVGFSIGGVDYFAADHTLPSGSGYDTSTDLFTTNPANGLAWTKGSLERALLVHEQVSQPIGNPKPRLTQCIVLADIILPPDRPTGTDEAVVGGADVAGVVGSGTAAAVAGSVVMAGIARDGSPMALAGGGTPAGVVGSGTPVAVAGGSTLATDADPTATVSPVCPTATIVDVTPTATAEAVTISATGA